MGRSTTSLRLADELRGRLAQRAGVEGLSVNALAEQLLGEGLAMAAHPGIVFRPGQTGRRAALASGPDVWTIASSLRRTSGSEAERVAQLAEEFGLHERQIVVALNYIAEFPKEVEARVKANDAAWEEFERIEKARQSLLV
jgi:hypothetical protein